MTHQVVEACFIQEEVALSIVATKEHSIATAVAARLIG